MIPERLDEITDIQAKQICDELRTRIIQSVSQTGGHLASSLGVVELTVAIHRVFDLNVDRLVFDVGHQCYAHKILTGRDGKWALCGSSAAYPVSRSRGNTGRMPLLPAMRRMPSQWPLGWPVPGPKTERIIMCWRSWETVR